VADEEEHETGRGSDGGRRREAETEPDYRFSLANERTFLAYIRPSLALLAVGVAAEHGVRAGDSREVAGSVCGASL